MFVFDLKKKQRKILVLCLGLLTVFTLAFVKKSEGISAISVTEGYYVPIIMYHSILKDSSLHGKYVISPQQLEEDLIYLSENGYTPILVEDLLNYVENDVPLPKKPVMITFDDGYYNNYLYAYPLMKKYGFRMVLSVIGKYSEVFSSSPDENAYYSHCTWEQLREMKNSGHVEIQNHSYNLHSTDLGRNGAKKTSHETLDEYAMVLAKDLAECQGLLEEKVGVLPTAFTYPYGAYSSESVEILKKMGFRATFSCEAKMNLITRDPDCLFGLYRFLRPSGMSSAEYFQKVVRIAKYVNE